MSSTAGMGLANRRERAGDDARAGELTDSAMTSLANWEGSHDPIDT